MQSEAQFNAWYADYWRMVDTVVADKINDEFDRPDVTQEVWLRVWERMDQWDESKAGVSTWLTHLTTNVCNNYLRDNVLRAPDLIAETDLMLEPDGEGEGWLDRNAIEYDTPESLAEADDTTKFLDSLPPQQRVAVELMQQGYGYEEIAERMGVTQATVRSHIRHVKAALGY
jgi:RNA polymerase sigma-70 factor (ECF subfamily)